MSDPIPATDYPQPNQGQISTGRAYAKDGATVANLFMSDRPKQVERPFGVDLPTLINNASQFVKFLKPFVTLEKQLTKAHAKNRAAEEACDSLYQKRNALLDKSLSE